MRTLPGFVFPFLLGFSVGLLLSYSVVTRRATLHTINGVYWSPDLNGYESEPNGIIQPEVTIDVEQIFFSDSQFHGDDTTVANRLYEAVRILCLVMTHRANHEKKAIHINATWGKRCTKLLFVTGAVYDGLPTLIFNVTDGRRYLGNKTREAFDHAYENYLADFDWFLKADDDTYVVMENLRYFLSAQDHNSPVFFGHTFVSRMKQGYASGGAGYVASREAVKRYGQRNKTTRGCRFGSGYEDVDFGLCMEALEVRLGDSLDALGRTRFHCFPTTVHIRGQYSRWYNSVDKYNGTKKGVDALSDYAISFHYVRPQEMYFMEFVVYHLNPYGVIKGLQNLNQIEPDDMA